MNFKEKWDLLVSDLKAAYPDFKDNIKPGIFKSPSVAPFIWVGMFPWKNPKGENSANIGGDRKAKVMIFCGVKKTADEHDSICESLTLCDDLIEILAAKHTMVFEGDGLIEFDGEYSNIMVSTTEFITYYN
jgi:hypothetical protein